MLPGTSNSTDPLTQARLFPERVFYATGVLLNADDFHAEQLYHRDRLARALAYLHGSGTVAGLAVEWKSRLEPGGTEGEQTFPNGRDEEIVVHPGLAIDRLGRLIEVPEPACIRLQNWLAHQSQSDLRSAHHPLPGTDGSTPIAISRGGGPTAQDGPITVGNGRRGLVVDVFLRFVLCEKGYTPSFAAGATDATDAAVPDRYQERYELSLILRPEPTQPQAATLGLIDKLPDRRWQSLTSVAALQAALLHDTWKGTGNPHLSSPNEYVNEIQDMTSVFLARLLVPMVESQAGLVHSPTERVQVDNYSRSFMYPTEAIAAQLVRLMTAT
ncbi:hypothetical protein ACQ4M4_21840 [Leptolyngbya sp. AN02str]|uniref:hypothetical protein n=1 Tax=Leptolyngbya sp. AN02str TaxID=3423363 RepID=UPI003D317B2E